MQLLVLALSLCVSAADDLGSFRKLPVIPLQGETHHVQGIDIDGKTLWVSSVDAPRKRGLLFIFDRDTGVMKHSVEVQQGSRFHPGGITLDDASLWVPVAEYRRSSTSTIQKRNARTLALETQFEVYDHIGAVAAVPEGLTGANWDARELFVWTKEGKELRKIVNPTGIAIQDMKFVDGRLIAAGLQKDRSGIVVWLEWPSLKLVRSITAAHTDRGVAFTHEGMTFRRDILYLLPEDGPSRLFSFEIR